MMDYIRNLQLLQKKLRTTMKNCFIQNHFNLGAQLIFTWTDDKFCQKQFLFVLQTGIREFTWEKKLAAPSQLKRRGFYRRTMLAFGIEQFVLVLNICL